LPDGGEDDENDAGININLMPDGEDSVMKRMTGVNIVLMARMTVYSKMHG
jgi:hypothetical protein